ncbi:MAG: hypothetical protein LUG95_07815 [Clostridiales bacterium]|nr:hypothetical protein [Clostridiales bacterium]
MNVTLSYDDISTFANFGDNDEVNLKYKKPVAEDCSYLALIAHYPDYENSELKDGGYSTLTYVVTVGGTKERVALDKNTEEEQYASDENYGISITDADEVYLITVSDRTYNMGDYDAFADTDSFELIDSLYSQTQEVAQKYETTDGGFDYDTALDEHLAVYQPQFDAAEFSLEDEVSTQSNEKLLKNQKGKDEIQSDIAERTYYAGRYAYLCCSGYSTSRLYGMWTGE